MSVLTAFLWVYAVVVTGLLMGERSKPSRNCKKRLKLDESLLKLARHEKATKL